VNNIGCLGTRMFSGRPTSAINFLTRFLLSGKTGKLLLPRVIMLNPR
jgi:hypothetical protein